VVVIIVRTFEEVRAAARAGVSLVPTMGYLHEGHLSLIAAANESGDTTVVSVFVNPTQFGDSADFDAYPYNEARDAALAEAAGCDIFFAPSADEVYPLGHRVTVSVGSVGDAMEGRFRHGHFVGVATVVAKLFAGVQPGRAFFGRKDAQQLAVIRTLRDGLRFPVEVIGMPTVREQDGLALSSRNTQIAEDARSNALTLSRALFCAADAIEGGERHSAAIAEIALSVAAETPHVEVEYVEVADSMSATPIDEIDTDAFVAIAVRVGGVRLIDNVAVDAATLAVDRGTMLTNPSILYEED
jgi:pantoate--beta-alanine ligase